MRNIILALIISTLIGFGLSNYVIDFANDGDNTVDTISTFYTERVNLRSDNEAVYLTTEIQGVAGYTNYTVQTNINGTWHDVITDSLGVTTNGGFETILIRNADSLYRFPYNNFRVKHITNDPSGEITVYNSYQTN